MEAPDQDAKYATKFNWWWRQVFPTGTPSRSIADLLAPWIEKTKHLLESDISSPEPASDAETPVAFPLTDADVNLAGQFLGIVNRRREKSALLYEIGKRISGKYEFRKPWINLSEARKAELEKRWPEHAQHIIYKVLEAGEAAPKGFCKVPTAYWNLRLNNTTLSDEFLRFVDAERKRVGIPNPKPNKGRRHKPLSWKPVELMDIKLHGLRKLNQSEGSFVRKAKALYGRVYNNGVMHS